MKYDRRIALSIFWVIAGIVLIGCSMAELVDEFWNGMGFAFVVVGGLQIARHIKYKVNEDYREEIDIASKDERNHFIRNKAWAWAGYIFVLVAALATVGFKVAGFDALSMLASGGVCLMMVLYWGAYMVLKRKY